LSAIATPPLKLPKRISTALLNALASGVVPRAGIEHLSVGRDTELATLQQDLDHMAAGGGAFRLVIGRYGAGKSFLLQSIRSMAMEQGFVVADADITPERRLVGSNGEARATYRELLHHLSTKSRPDGGALPIILERWIAGIQSQVVEESQKTPQDEGFDALVEDKIRSVIQTIADLVNGFEFSNVIIAYWNAYRAEDDRTKESVLRWLRGEFSTKTESRQAIGVRVIIDDDSWYDYIKLIGKFVADIGYKGLLIILDEAIHLTKITTSISRQNNYDKLLAMFNDTLQGRVNHLGIFIGGTPQFLEDPRRGLFSDPAWQRRTQQNRLLATSNVTDAIAPVVRLEPLSDDSLIGLMERLGSIHQCHYGYEKRLSHSELNQVLQVMRSRIGGGTGTASLLTPGELVRDFTGVLNVLHQNPKLSIDAVLQKETEVKIESSNESSISQEFAEFTL
jgi:P-loop Domain of unknown function (DUF2791)